jgi:hypothetical protein
MAACEFIEKFLESATTRCISRLDCVGEMNEK